MADGRILGRGLGQRPCGSIGRGIGRSETWKRTASETWPVAPVRTLAGQSLGRERLWYRCERFWNVDRFWPRSVGDSEANGVGTLVGFCWRQRGSIGVGTSVDRRLGVGWGMGSGLIGVGALFGMGILWVDRRQGIGRGLGSLG